MDKKFGPSSRGPVGNPAAEESETGPAQAASEEAASNTGKASEQDRICLAEQDVLAQGKMAWWRARESGQKDAQNKLARNRWGVCEFSQALGDGRARHLVRQIGHEGDFDDNASWMSWKSGAASSDASTYSMPHQVKRSSSLGSTSSARWMQNFLKERADNETAGGMDLDDEPSVQQPPPGLMKVFATQQTQSAAARNHIPTENAAGNTREENALPTAGPALTGLKPVFGQRGNTREENALPTAGPALTGLKPVFGQRGNARELSPSRQSGAQSSSNPISEAAQDMSRPRSKQEEADQGPRRWGNYQFKQDDTGGGRPRHMARRLAPSSDDPQAPSLPSREGSWVSFRSDSAVSNSSSEAYNVPESVSGRLMQDFLAAKDDPKKVDNAMAKMLKELYLRNQQKLAADDATGDACPAVPAG
eukprot:TRINITY_DN6940_c0_g2_i1.p1 TRINITY_DN6940_c0_g2~~TRINITY_DN6940_c0_g2_i1.p1  ORF type:complete len:420 (-),score=83.81 TRINITY_DN6940_c0_g2_i1:108-1367(-)